MKKIFAIMLAVLLCMSLYGCGEEKTAEPEKISKEELLSQAISVKDNELHNESMENLARAKEHYCNKALEISGAIQTIEADHVVLGAKLNYVTDVYLPQEELVTLDSGQYIAVVGETTDEIIETSENYGGMTFSFYHYQMPTAYIAKDKFEYDVTVNSIRPSDSSAEVLIGKVYRRVYFADGVDVKNLQKGDSIKIQAKPYNINDDYEYREAIIVG